MKKLICAVLIAGAIGGAAKAADLPTAKPAEALPASRQTATEHSAKKSAIEASSQAARVLLIVK
jgi:hypothetical protein